MVRPLLMLICCLAAVVNVATVQDKKISTPHIIGENYGNEKTHSSIKPKMTREAGVANPASSPTKFGFVPTRTAASYAAKAPRPSYFQHAYKVKDSTKREPAGYQTQHSSGQQIYIPSKVSAQVVQSDESVPYLQPELSTGVYSQKQYQPIQYYQQLDGGSIGHGQYQQPAQQEYQQYETVQYVTDNNVYQTSGQQYPESAAAAAPEYYQIQQYQEPVGSVEGAVDPKGTVQYVMYIPEPAVSQYPQNAITSDFKYQELAGYQTRNKFSSGSQKKYPAYKLTVPQPSNYEKVPEYQYTSYQNYKRPAYNQQQEIVISRHPKSLLDSYIPSVVQLRWLEQQKHAHKYSR